MIIRRLIKRGISHDKKVIEIDMNEFYHLYSIAEWYKLVHLYKRAITIYKKILEDLPVTNVGNLYNISILEDFKIKKNYSIPVDNYRLMLLYYILDLSIKIKNQKDIHYYGLEFTKTLNQRNTDEFSKGVLKQFNKLMNRYIFNMNKNNTHI